MKRPISIHVCHNKSIIRRSNICNTNLITCWWLLLETIIKNHSVPKMFLTRINENKFKTNFFRNKTPNSMHAIFSRYRFSVSFFFVLQRFRGGTFVVHNNDFHSHMMGIKESLFTFFLVVIFLFCYECSYVHSNKTAHFFGGITPSIHEKTNFPAENINSGTFPNVHENCSVKFPDSASPKKIKKRSRIWGLFPNISFKLSSKLAPKRR